MTNKRYQIDTKMGEMGIPPAKDKSFPKEAREYKEYLSGMSDALLATTAYNTEGSRRKIRPKTTLNGKNIGSCTRRPLSVNAQRVAPAVFKNLTDAIGVKAGARTSENEINALVYAIDKTVVALDAQSKGDVKALQDFAKGSIPHYRVLRVVGFFDGSDNDYDYGIVNFYNYVCSSHLKKAEKGENATEDSKQSIIQRRVMTVFVDLLLKNGREPLSEVFDVVHNRAQAKSLTFDHLHITGIQNKVDLDQRRLLSLYVAFIATYGNPDKVKPLEGTAPAKVTTATTTATPTTLHVVPPDFNHRAEGRARKLESKCVQLLGEKPTPSALIFKNATLALFNEKVDTIRRNLMACLERHGTCSPTNLKAYTQSIDAPFSQASEALKAYSSALDEEASIVRDADGLLDQIVQLITRRDTHVAAEACKSMIERINLEATKEI